ncbi:MAG: glycosyltransferase family 39 protein [Acidimicrobiales bacterium]
MSSGQAPDTRTSGRIQAPSRVDRRDRRDIRRWDLVLQLPLVLTVGAALGIGIFERVWYLQHDPINSDEALVGILARHLLAGHANAFLLGQPYGGVEPYVVAAMFGAFGSSPITLQVPVVVLDAVACVLVWRVGRRLVRRPAIALVAAAAMWAAPQSAVWNSTLEYGFRGVTLVCGVAMLLLALRITQEDASRVDAPLLGLVAGVGWWSSPEIAYFAVPTVLWLLSWAWHTRRASTGSSLNRVDFG